MIKTDDLELYSPQISKVVSVLKTKIVPTDASGVTDAVGKKLLLKTVNVVYDRNHRGKNWFILDLRT